jgi:hypothetical protein
MKSENSLVANAHIHVTMCFYYHRIRAHLAYRLLTLEIWKVIMTEDKIERENRINSLKFRNYVGVPTCAEFDLSVANALCAGKHGLLTW